MSTVRWTFTEVDTSATYTVPINPDSMTSPYPQRILEHSAGTRILGSSLIHTFRHPDAAREWEFGGVIRTQAHHDALDTWSKKPGKVRVSDHLGRTWEVLFTKFAPVDRRPNQRTPWRLRYTMTALVLRQITD